MSELNKVLIVDDDDAVRISLSLHFEDIGYEVFEADSAEQALDLIKSVGPQLAVVDLRLPKMDGIELIRSIKCNERDCVYIIHTGSVEVEIPDDILAMPCVSDIVFFKPIDDLNEISDEGERLYKAFQANS